MAKLTKREKEKIEADRLAKEKANRIKNRKTTSRSEDLNKLAEITGNKKPKEEPVKTEVISTEIKNDAIEITTASNEIKVEPVVKVEVIKEETEPEIKPPAAEELKPKTLSLWDEIVQPTNEDKNLKDQINKIPENLDNLASEANGLKDLSEMEGEELAKKQSYKVKAGIVIEIADVGFMLVCILLTWNFDDENQRKFKLNNESKGAIKYNLAKVYEMEGKRLNPKKDIWILILGSYAPMLLVAIITLINNLKAKQEAKKHKAAFLQAESAASKQLAEMQLKLEAMQHEKALLEREAELSRPAKKVGEVKREFIPSPSIGRNKKAEPAKRGRKLGVKVGTYKKRK